MARHKLVDGVRIPLTEAEEMARDAEEAAWEAGAFDRAIARLREDRNRRLAATDWNALQDVTMSDAMRDYRQELRDLPAGLTTVEQVEAVVWPVK
jgi:hypothetical protein